MECDIYRPDNPTGSKFTTGLVWICELLDTEPPLVRLVDDCKSVDCEGTHFKITKGDKVRV